jgi:hypothetical protein
VLNGCVLGTLADLLFGCTAWHVVAWVRFAVNPIQLAQQPLTLSVHAGLKSECNQGHTNRLRQQFKFSCKKHDIDNQVNRSDQQE